MRAPIDPLGSLKYLLARLNPFGERAWALHRASGLRFRVNLRDVVGRTILRRAGYEPDLTAWLLDALERSQGGVFVDVGANIGWFSLHAARLARIERVLAIEPDAGNHHLLQQNIERNALGHRVEAIACAVGAEPGLARLHRYKASNRGRHSLLVEHGRGSTWVPVEPLDGLLERVGAGGDVALAAIKIDVEGYEPWVVRGAPAALARAQVLLVELSPAMSQAGGADLSEMLDAIAAAGFVPETWDQPGTVPDFAGLRAHQAQVTVGFRRAE